MKQVLVSAAAGTLLATFGAPALADYPDKPITMMVAFKAGGGADTLGRIVTKAITAKLGWKFIVQNKAGAGGAVMAKTLMRADPDGYTIGMSVSDPFAFDPIYKPKLGFTANDFTYLGTIAKFQMALLAMKDRGWKTLADAIKAGKAKGGLTVGTMGTQLAVANKVIAKHYGVKLKTVPARGGRGVMNQLLGGHVDIGWGAGIQARYVSAGKMEALASAMKTRLRQNPDKQTLAELGMGVIDMTGYFMMVAPKGLPPAVTAKLSDAIKAAVASPGIQKLVNERIRLVAEFLGPDDLAALIKSRAEASKKLIDAAK